MPAFESFTALNWRCQAEQRFSSSNFLDCMDVVCLFMCQTCGPALVISRSWASCMILGWDHGQRSMATLYSNTAYSTLCCSDNSLPQVIVFL